MIQPIGDYIETILDMRRIDPKLSTDQARLIAANPDGCIDEELQMFIEWIGDGLQLDSSARILWGLVDQRIQAAKALRTYVYWTLRARGARSKGRINDALQYENRCEHIYNHMPFFAQW